MLELESNIDTKPEEITEKYLYEAAGAFFFSNRSSVGVGDCPVNQKRVAHGY